MNKPQKKTAEIRQFVLESIENHPGDITSVVSSNFGISRQAGHRYVQKLVSEGLVIAEGATRDRKYSVKPLAEFSIKLSLGGLEEDKVWRQYIREKLNDPSSNVLQICHHGFTEMVNNAIDHSEGTELQIAVRQTYNLIELHIMDNGAGIFNKIQRELHLEDPLHAILELSKGKLTTDPAHHSGEGIFFTSRMFDEFRIFSGIISFAYIEDSGDWLIEDRNKFISGTEIILKINPKSQKTTRQVFDQYTTNDYGFNKTRVPVFLAQYGGENLISRSQAKRLLTRFERFKEIILDFENVDSIGQAFADEIFRVFQLQNPNIRLIPINTSEQVQNMIAHVTSGT